MLLKAFEFPAQSIKNKNKKRTIEINWREKISARPREGRNTIEFRHAYGIPI